MVYLRLFDRNGEQVRAVSGVLDPRRSGLRRAAQILAHRLLVPKRYTGDLRVEVDVPNAWIYLDGRRVARSESGHLPGIPVGTHALRVTHEAYRDFVRFVEIEFKEETRVKVELSAYPVKAEEMRLTDEDQGRTLTDDELPWYRRWWAVAAFGGVIFAAATTTAALLIKGTVDRDQELVVRPR
jgi:hypothetical protein